MSVGNYHYTLRNIPEESRSQHIGSIFKGETVAWERVEWIDLALDRDAWWPIFGYGNKLIAQNAENFRTS